MQKEGKYKVDFDDAGDLRWFLLSGNGKKLARSEDTFFKRKNGERSVERLRRVLLEMSDADIIDAVMEFRRTALAAQVEPGPGRGRRAAAA